MGKGTMIKFSIKVYQSVPSPHPIDLLQYPNSGTSSNMITWNIPLITQVLQDHPGQQQYAEFSSVNGAQGAVGYALRRNGVDIGSLHLTVTQVKSQDVCGNGGKYQASITFQNSTNEYSLLVFNNGQLHTFDQTNYPTGFLLDDAPPHWQSGDPAPVGVLELQVVSNNLANPPVNTLSNLCAHNAYANPDAKYIYFQQLQSIKKQLELGVRSLMLDTYLYNFPNGGAQNQIVVSHGTPGGTMAGVQMLFEEPETLTSVMSDLTTFLDNNKDAYIFIFLEDYVKTATTWQNFLKDYSSYLYGWNATNKSISFGNNFNVNAAQPYTTARLDDIKGKIILFTDVSTTGVIPYTYDYCIETVYGNASMGVASPTSMTQRASSAAKTSFTNYGNRPFVLVNQFPDFEAALAVKNFGKNMVPILEGMGADDYLMIPGAIMLVGMGQVASAIAGISWEAQKLMVNNGEQLMAKAAWTDATPHNQEDVAAGHYGRFPNFFALDYVSLGGAFDGVGMSAQTMISNWMEAEKIGFPHTLPLGMFGLDGLNPTAIWSYVFANEALTGGGPLTVSDGEIRNFHPPFPEEEPGRRSPMGVSIEINMKSCFTELHGDYEYQEFVRLFINKTFNGNRYYTAKQTGFLVPLNAFIPNLKPSDPISVEVKNSANGVTVFTAMSIMERKVSNTLTEKYIYLGGWINRQYFVAGTSYEVHVISGSQDVLAATFQGKLDNFILLPGFLQGDGTVNTTNLFTNYQVSPHHQLIKPTLDRVRNLRGTAASRPNIIVPVPNPNFLYTIDANGNSNPVHQNMTASLVLIGESSNTNLGSVGLDPMAFSIPKSILRAGTMQVQVGTTPVLELTGTTSGTKVKVSALKYLTNRI